MDAEIFGTKECVGYVGRFGKIRTRASTEPMGIENSKNSHFQGQ